MKRTLTETKYCIAAAFGFLWFAMPAFSQAPQFQAGDFKVSTSMSDSAPKSGQNANNGPFTDTLRDAVNGASMITVVNGQANSTSSSEAHVNSPGTVGAASNNAATNVVNTFVLVPRAGFTGTQARVVLNLNS